MTTESISAATEGDDLTVLEVAAELRVFRTTVYREIKAGRLFAYRVGRRMWRIPRSSLAAYRAANSNQPVAA